jgi:hypothetical protein
MGRIVSKRGRQVPEPEAQQPEEIDDWIEQMTQAVDDLEEVIRKTTQGVPDVNYIDFGDDDEWTRI